MINNSQYMKIIQYLSILGGLEPPLPPRFLRIYIYIYYHVQYVLCVFLNVFFSNLYLYNTVLSVLFCVNKDIIIMILDRSLVIMNNCVCHTRTCDISLSGVQYHTYTKATTGMIYKRRIRT